MSKNLLYDQQKGITNVDKKYSTIIEFVTLVSQDNKKTIIRAKDGRNYTIWNNQDSNELLEELKTGEEVSVYVSQRKNQYGRNPYRNIIKSPF